MTTGTCRVWRLFRRELNMRYPSSPGIITSTIIKSGICWTSKCWSWSPLQATATSKPLRLSTNVTISRISLSSSTTKMRFDMSYSCPAHHFDELASIIPLYLTHFKEQTQSCYPFLGNLTSAVGKACPAIDSSRDPCYDMWQELCSRIIRIDRITCTHPTERKQ